MPRGLTPDERAELRRRWHAGLSVNQIAVAMRIAATTVTRNVRAMGLPARGSPVKPPRLAPGVAHRPSAIPPGVSTLPPLPCLQVPLPEIKGR